MLFKLLIRHVAHQGYTYRFQSSAFLHTKRVHFKGSQSPKYYKFTVVVPTKVRSIHVTSPKRAIPPVLIYFLRFVLKAGTIVSGKIIRKWWARLTPEEKTIVLDKLRSKKSTAAFIGTVFAGFFALFYLEHMLEDPLTGRRRFIILKKKQVDQIAEYEYQKELHRFKQFLVPNSHPIYRRVSRVANVLLLANRDIPAVRDTFWSVTVVDKPEVINMFVLPNGKIFVFTGMLNVCTNDDQLAVVLGHEMSHAILNHLAEMMSRVFVVEFILLFPSLIFWIIFPNAWAVFSEWITSKLAALFIHLPFSRAIEKEADEVGLALAAKACYDVREAADFWKKMKVIGNDSPIEWLSTHPTHQSRQLDMQHLLPEAMKIRDKNNCPPLAPRFR